MGKTCAFLGNDYDKFMGVKCGHSTPSELKTQIRKEAVNLIENEDVDTFLVGEKGGYEIDAYDVILDIQKEYPDIQIILVISAMSDLHEIGIGDGKQVIERRGFDDFILPPKCELGYKKLCIVYRNRYIIENTDFIIAYNKYKGKASEFCKSAKAKGIKVIELAKEHSS
ncbi:MAG: hypothetical protein IJ532_02590 [Alphaproteobacteria bacterium]|nr:hypothetical protein [Alphaproteobacteria bacterium]